MFILVLTYGLDYVLHSKNTFTVMGGSWNFFLTVKESLYILKGYLPRVFYKKPVCVYIYFNLFNY